MVCIDCKYREECECFSEIVKGMRLLENGLPAEIYAEVEEVVDHFVECEFKSEYIEAFL